MSGMVQSVVQQQGEVRPAPAEQVANVVTSDGEASRSRVPVWEDLEFEVEIEEQHADDDASFEDAR